MEAGGRRFDIDQAKGLAILLVVFGHLIANGYPPGNAWYDTAKDIIYSFHMPFFMYLSGYVFSLTDKQRSADYGALLRDRALRLLVPFVLFGLVIVTGKYAFHFFVYVDDPPHSFPDGLKALVVETASSPALSIWYIYVLFLYSAATPLLWRLGLRWPGVAVLGAALFCVPAPDWLYLDRAASYLLFFALGGVMATHRFRLEPWYERLLPLWLALFALTLATQWMPLPDKARLLICGIAAIPALHGLVRSGLFAEKGLLQRLGDNAFAIYLLNTIMIGLVKAGYLQVAPLAGMAALPALLLFFAAGTLGPILVRRYLVPRLPVLNGLIP